MPSLVERAAAPAPLAVVLLYNIRITSPGGISPVQGNEVLILRSPAVKLNRLYIDFVLIMKTVVMKTYV